jgi:3-carboxy-cis,cis-muconate cycloisomerase
MLVARDGADLLLADLDRVAAACAALADKHRSTVMAGRTLLQQALPTTFGLKAAGWLLATLEGHRLLLELRKSRLSVQFGGATGTLAALGDRGLEVARNLATELGLAKQVLPWHTNRTRVTELGLLLGLVAGTMGKIALDVVLLSQSEVAEVAEPAMAGRGGSSTLPHKRNPVGSALARACVQGVNGQVGVLLAAAAQEQERAAGAWQAEAPAVSEALRLTSGAVALVAEVLEGLTVDAARMRANLDAGGGLVMSESVMMALASKIGRLAAHDLVEQAVRSAAAAKIPFREILLADPAVSEQLSAAELDAALDPGAYLGSALALVDEALSRYESERRQGE